MADSRKLRTYEVRYGSETQTMRSRREGIVHASVGVFADGTWFATLTTQADPVKAAKAARGTNPYAARYVLADALTEVPDDAPKVWMQS